MYIGLKKPATFPLTIKDKLLVVIGDFYLGPISDTLTPTTQVGVLDCLLSNILLVQLTKICMVMRESHIVLLVMKGVV